MSCPACIAGVHSHCYHAQCNCSVCILYAQDEQDLALASREGVNEIAKISEVVSNSAGVSLYALGEKPFSIKSVTFGTYEGKKNAQIETVETFKGSDLNLSDKAKKNMDPKVLEEFPKTEHNVFHTNREVIVKSLDTDLVKETLEKGESIGPCKCQLNESGKGNPYWELVDA